MCGIFGILCQTGIKKNDLLLLAAHAENRGRDSSGLYVSDKKIHSVYRAVTPITNLLKTANILNADFVMGHSRLVTNGLIDNQPVKYHDKYVIHNGIIVNDAAYCGHSAGKLCSEDEAKWQTFIPLFISYFIP